MMTRKDRANSALALLILAAFVLGCSQLKNLGGGGDLADANKLIDSANQDLTAIQQIAEDNRDKEGDISRQLNNNDVDGAKNSIDDSIKAIDEGLKRGDDAADKFDKASKMNLDPKVKEYLSLKSQSVRKTVEAFQQLKKGLVSVRDNMGARDRATIRKAQADTNQASENYDKLMTEAQNLERQADDIARENPDKIKG
jgi:hypothetical protein